MSNAIAGKYAVLEKGEGTPPTIWAEVDEIFSIGDLTQRFSVYDVTHHGPSPYREILPGLYDVIEMSIEMNYVWAQYEEFKGYAESRVSAWWRLRYEDSSTHTFQAYVTECSPKTPLDDRITYSIILTIDGPIESANV